MKRLFKFTLRALSVALTLTTTSTAVAQAPGDDDLSSRERTTKEVVNFDANNADSDERIFTVAEQLPTFPGGEAELAKFIAQNIVYPQTAAERGIQGRVIVQFVVQKDGSIGQAKVVKSVDPDLDKEALRVVRKLPKFVPSKMNGQAVNAWYTLPVTFRL